MSCIPTVHIQILGIVGAALSSASLEKGAMVRVLAIPRRRRRGHPGGHPLLVLRIDLDEEESGVGSRHVSLHSLLQLNVLPVFRKELFRMFLQVSATQALAHYHCQHARPSHPRHPPIHSLNQSLTHSLTQSLTHSPTTGARR